MPDQATTNGDSDDDKDNGAPSRSFASTDPRDHPPQDQPTDTRNSDPAQKNQQSAIAAATIFQAIFTFLMLLVNIGYVWVATKQWGAMSDQVAAMGQQVIAMNTQNKIISDEFVEMKVQSNFMKG